MVFNSSNYALFRLWMLISMPFISFSQSSSPLEIEKLRYAKALLKIAIAEKDSVQLAEAYYKFGKIEASKLDFQKSNAYFLQSLKIQESRGETYELGRLYLRLYENELKQWHYLETLKYIKKAKEIFERNKIGKGLKECDMAMGQVFSINWPLIENGQIKKSNADSALYYYKKFESAVLVEKNELEVAQIRLLIGVILLQKNDKKALWYLENSSIVHKKFNQQSPLINCLLVLANAYTKFGKPDKAFKIIKETEKMIQLGTSTTSEVFINLEGAYVSYYQAKANWKMAFEHLQKQIEFTEKSHLSDRNGAVSKLNIAYETDKKDKLLSEQDKNLSLQKQFLWVVGSLLVTMLIISYILFKLFKKNQVISRRNAILLREQNHRVKNNLQVVSSLLTLQSNLLKDGEAKKVVDESQLRIETMTILHRQLYDNQEALDKIDMEAFITELAEIIVESYGLFKVEIVYEITLKELNADEAVFVGLLINELVSNACKYAFKENEEFALKIMFYKNNKSIILKVKDNGEKRIPFKKNTLELSHNSPTFGIKLINMMVLQLNGSIEYIYQNGSEFIVKF